MNNPTVKRYNSIDCVKKNITQLIKHRNKFLYAYLIFTNKKIDNSIENCITGKRTN